MSRSETSFADLALAPADALRAAVYRGAAPWLGRLAGDRATRVRWSALLALATSAALSLWAPGWSLAWSPLLLGVPHLLAGVDVLVVRPGLHRRAWLALGCGPPLLALSLGAPLAVGLLALVPVVLDAGGARGRGVSALAAVMLLVVAAWRFDDWAQLAFVHLHNVIAVALWWRVRGRSARDALFPALAAGFSTLLLVGGLDRWVTWPQVDDFVASLAPCDDPTLAGRAVVLFAFWQSLHYAVWLRLMPDEVRTRPAPRPFRDSAASLVQRWGVAAVTLTGVAWLSLVAWGLRDVEAARLGYLHLAAFHGVLELAVLARQLVGTHTALASEV